MVKRRVKVSAWKKIDARFIISLISIAIFSVLVCIEDGTIGRLEVVATIVASAAAFGYYKDVVVVEWIFSVMDLVMIVTAILYVMY